MRTFPYGRQSIEQDDVDAVLGVLKGDFLTTGPAVAAFEASLQEALGVKHAIAVSSGTAALHLAATALDLKPNDAVIVPAITFAATSNAVLYCGAKVVFADIDSANGCMSVSSAERCVQLIREQGWRFRAIFPVHYGGFPCRMQELVALARAHDAVIVEDACHALGASYRLDKANPWVKVGSGGFSQMAAWSFHPVKHIATGEGGAITTDDSALAAKLRKLRSHGMCYEPAQCANQDLALDPSSGEPNPWFHEMQDLGFNYRLTDIQAALGLSQLHKLPRFVKRRREIAAAYRTALRDTPHLSCLTGDSSCGQHSYHLFSLLIDFAALGRSRRAVMLDLRARGVGTQVHYIPVFFHDFYQKNQHLWHADDCPNAKAFYAAELSIPMYPALTLEDVVGIAATISDYVQS